MHRDPVSELTDAELLTRSLVDPEAFGIFYERHERMVFGYHMRHTRDLEVSADLTAETFAAALVARARFRPGPEPASAWLIAIAHHKLLTSYRRGHVDARARKKLGIGPIALTDASLERAEAIIDDERFPMQELLDGLPADQREAIVARVLDEREYDDISRTLRCSEAAARKRVSRGLATLRRQLQRGVT
ncbi:MAG TPA: RNA polymerase sigma factor [Solirubrobacter sp.]|nr:RNA polymerase sigma factor [Solirubrobacter sp.]